MALEQPTAADHARFLRDLVTGHPRYRRWRRSPVSDEPVHHVVVPPGPDGRPGELLQAHSASLRPPFVDRRGQRTDFRVLLTAAGSCLSAFCLGRAADRGDAEQSALRARASLAAKCIPVAAPEERPLLGERAVALHFGSAKRLTVTDWHLVHAGWAFVIGALRVPRDDEADALARAEAVLATWRWIEAPPADGSAGA